MRKILVTGGTGFVSKYVAKYYVDKGDEVYVLNRNSREQIKGATLIEADRHLLNGKLKDFVFDVVYDVTSFTGEDVKDLLDGLGNFKDYIMISSSAVYPEYNPQPFSEEQTLGLNKFWGKYGTDKIDAENVLMERVPQAYILRPPYIYGQMNNVYREAFVFDCAIEGRTFYIPRDGQMKLQFLHVDDMCKIMDAILEKRPEQHIFNVGNEKAVSIIEWVELCYKVVGTPLKMEYVYDDIEQRLYFPFYNYEYFLDVTNQKELFTDALDLEEGLRQAYEWYVDNKNDVNRRDYMGYIDGELKK